MKITKFLSTVTGILLLITMPAVMAQAAIPTLTNYQGYLKDSGGNPVADGDYSITFSLYTVASGGTSEWTETQTVTVAGGVFDVQLGLTTAFPYSLFEADLYLGVWIGGEPDEMSPRQLLTATPFAMKAGDADTLEGQRSVDLDQSTHLADSSNPHNVTAVQVGAVTPAEISAHTAVTDAHHAKTTSFTDLADQAADSQIPATIARDAEVTWANLPDIPAGFADDVDNVGGIAIEVDPEVGLNTLNYVPKWNGTALVTGSIFDNGNVGIGTPSPSAKLDVDAGSSGPAATIGYANTATGDSAIAMGYGTEALHQHATAMGNQTNATGFDSTAMGYGTTASDSQSTAMGHLTTASGSNSTAMGYGTTASGSHSTAMGGSTTASNSYSTAMGYGTTASGHLSTAMGNRMIAQGDNSFGIGLNDTLNAITQDNTMAIMGGDVGIGMTTPVAKLHVRATGGVQDAVRGAHGTNVGVLGHDIAGVWAEGDGIGLWAISHSSGAAIIADNNTGNVIWGRGVGGNTVFLVSADGTTTTGVLEITGGSDLAEPFEISPADIAGPGAVVCIDPENPGELEVSRTPYDRRVAGIISGAGGIKPGMVMGQEGSQAHGSTLVALTGRVFCRADASNGPIQPGDLLTTSDLPGHAMKVTDYTKAQGAIIGKAMSSLKQDQGLVLVLVTLQ